MGGRGGSSHSGGGVGGGGAGGGGGFFSPGAIAANATMGHAPDTSKYKDFGQDSLAADSWYTKNVFDLNKWNQLDADAQQGVKDYTSSSYVYMNGYLRFGEAGLKAMFSTANIPKIKKQIADAERGLDAFTLKHDTITYRGIGSDEVAANLLGCSTAQLRDASVLSGLIGKKVTDKGFMSSGVSSDAAWYGVQLKILNHAGTKGMYVEPITKNHGEFEFLYNRNTSFKVHQIKTNSSGKVSEIVLETVAPKKKKKK